jgi:urea transporter/murein DD-endopeptidase MepM/ murein hydrolase activator NlpD
MLLAYAEEVLGSYSILFFSNSRLLGILLLLVSFFHPFAGFSGLLAVLLAVAIASFSGLARSALHKGLYSYNALIIGIGMGSFYNPGSAFFLLLFIAVFLSVILSAIFASRLFPKQLPFLTLPFVICFWLVILVSREFTAIDFTTRNIYWLNEIYGYGGKSLVDFLMFFENLPVAPAVLAFFKSISGLFFQENVLAGMILFVGLLLHSRIAATLLVMGFAASLLFNSMVHAYDSGPSFQLFGGNVMIVAMAVGSFFTIPSVYSYLWALFSVPLTYIMVVALGKLTALLNLPVASLPFCIVTILMVYFFSLVRQRRIVLTPVQLYSPEKNLYHFINARKRLFSERFLHLQLPFLGKWIVSQGYDSTITHKGEWSKALDFVIVDAHMKTYATYAIDPDNFYCWNKPVLSPAAGFVQEIIDHIDDNEIGKINRKDNWGNTIIIRHLEGLYTKMSHLKKNSFRVKVGDYVKQGQVLAACGNSGRSPEPHLHFQVQITPFVGSKTLAYPFEVYKSAKNGETRVAEFSTPAETELVSSVEVNEAMAKAFELLPGLRMEAIAESYPFSSWEVFTDAFNRTYIYCYTTKSTAYFNRSSCFFYFTSFYGDRKSLLYQFYLSCYKVGLSTELPSVVQDEFPLQWSRNNPGKWLQDLAAPFYIFRRLYYESENRLSEGSFFDAGVTVISRQLLQYPGFRKQLRESVIGIKENRLQSFTFNGPKNESITCTLKM